MGLTTAPVAWSQSKGASKEVLERNYKKKLESEFLGKISWQTLMDDALAKAREKDLPIVGYFTRSWSP